MTNPTALLILGMHRSGTSAAARVVNLLGASLGNSLMPAAADNARGFWEQAEIVPVHERLLAELQRSWDSMLPLPHSWETGSTADTYARTLASIIEKEFADADLWAIKDPRLCLTLPLWQCILNERNIEAKALLVFRHPAEVAASLQKRDGFSSDTSFMLWLHYTLAMESSSRQMPRSFIHYDDLLKDWKKNLTHAANTLGIAWPELHTAEDDINQFLSDSMRHNRTSSFSPEGTIEQLAYDVYNTMLAMASGETTDGISFDDAHAKYHDILSQRLPILEDYETAKAALSQRIYALDDALLAKEQQIEELHNLLNQERNTLAERSGQYKRQIAELSGIIDGIYTSSSWKVTAPLRQINRLMKKQDAGS